MRIIIADDHPLYLEAVLGQLEKAFPAGSFHTARNLADTLALLERESVDLVMLDYSMPGMNGVEGIPTAIAAARGTPVAIMSGVADDDAVRACIAAGARGFLPKTLESRVFIQAVGLVGAGGTYVPAEFAALPSKPAAPATPTLDPSLFTSREMEVLALIVAGASNKEIARQLDLQEVTIKLHLTRIFQKLGVKNRSHAAVTAVRGGLVADAVQ
ncbi:LuxR C-terminal-related transcriptional regulator [Paramagnetospirillum magneticum]|uniref:Response regulator containing a CheY-like receiver domain and an HTH DNA-binding domain n=1 Tax=Paramagnetospirillum magneticum (strain ATCC 700264 / AMB-1) TaxID=342108 RepID=Q2W650_PARM1|nr:response regulator transcription factor [Paramagnetospirillum magneticum]BAE50675.1 Response regulator containing a CheY-like receiver domain and an HTH DNA-binding domain [Paramagnetospirillum magneticum AMB-1]